MANPNVPPASNSSSANSMSSDVSTAANTLKADAGAVVEEVQDTAGKVAAEARDQVSQIADQAREQIGHQTEQLKGLAGEQKELIAAHIGGVADAINRVASDLESNNGTSARYARVIADGAEKLSSTVRDNDVDALLGMAQDFGRRQPAAFVGIAAVMGFAASRFLLASAGRQQAPSAAEQATTPGIAISGEQ